jgi:pimeloyl-ACP methyl ester carboxylesterase
MKGWKIVILLAIMIASSSALADGTVDSVVFYSPTLGYDEPMLVYLPEGYDGITRYPVIYFLHGIGVDYSATGFTTTILDSFIAGGMLDPMIFVRPNGMCPPYGGSFWHNSVLYGPFEDYASHDVIQYVDSHYATLPYRETRAIMGFGTGGYGALTIAFKYPDSFRNAVSLSGMLNLEPYEHWLTMLYLENPGPPYNFVPWAGWFTGAVFTACGAFSPNLSNPPFYVDFMLDEQGEVNQSMLAEWHLQMPYYTAGQHLDELEDLGIFFDCGTLDELGFYVQNLAFCDSLDALGVSYEFESFIGGNTDHLPDRFVNSLPQFDQALCPVDSRGLYLTWNQGQWGQDMCNGSNVACFRDQYFDEVYPLGLVVGVGNTLTFTTSQAVGEALPCGGRPGLLHESMVDPTHLDLSKHGGQLAEQVIVLKLNMDYAEIAGYRYLDALEVGEGNGGFTDMTVGEVLTASEQVLGGDPSALPAGETTSSLVRLLNRINGNFEGGMATVDPDLLLQLSFGPCMPGRDMIPSGGEPITKGEVASADTKCQVHSQICPNPFNPTTQIRFELADAGLVKVRVYNVLGQLVAELANGNLSAGVHSVTFDASTLSSGLYICRIESRGFTDQKKMLLMK